MSNQAKSILFVEDEKAISRVMKLKLEQSNLEVTLAKTGQEAMDYFDENTYDLVLLDLILPEKDGFSVLSHIREQNTEIDVVVLTNLGQPEDRKRLQDIGISGYYVKSEVPIYELVNKIKTILKV